MFLYAITETSNHLKNVHEDCVAPNVALDVGIAADGNIVRQDAYPFMWTKRNESNYSRHLNMWI